MYLVSVSIRAEGPDTLTDTWGGSGAESHRFPRETRQQIGLLVWLAYLDRHPWGSKEVHLGSISRAFLSSLGEGEGEGEDLHHTPAFSSLSPSEARAEASSGKTRGRIATSERLGEDTRESARTVARNRSKGG